MPNQISVWKSEDIKDILAVFSVENIKVPQYHWDSSAYCILQIIRIYTALLSMNEGRERFFKKVKTDVKAAIDAKQGSVRL